MAKEQRYVRLQEESSYGTLLTDGSEWTEDLIFESEDFGTTADFAENEHANQADLREARIATVMGEGSVEMWGRVDELYRLMHLLLGPPHTEETDVDGVRESIFVPDRDSIPSFAAMVGREESEFVYRGQVMDEFEFTSEPGENLVTSFSSLGQAPDDIDVNDKFTVDAQVASADALTLSPLQVLTMTDLTVELANSERTDLQAANLAVTNNLDDDLFVLGSDMFTQKPLGQRRETTADLDFKDEDYALYEDFINGTRAELNKLFVMDEVIGTTTVNYQMEIIIPTLQYREYDGAVSGRDSVRTSVSGRALADDYTIASADLDVISTDVTVTSDMIVRIVSEGTV